MKKRWISDYLTIENKDCFLKKKLEINILAILQNFLTKMIS